MTFEPTDDPADGFVALLRATGRGDRVAFGRLFDEFGPQTYGLVVRIVGNGPRTEEVVQETWLQIWREAARFDPARGGARGWILTIARRRAVDAMRHDRAEVVRDLNYHAQQPPDFDRVSEAVVDADESRRVRRCLDGLTDLQREAIDLAYYGGLTYAQVAERLAVNPATVKTRIRDGLRRLRACLGGA